MANVRELFAELFAYLLLFEQMTLGGEFQPSYEDVRGELSRLLEKQEAAALRQGMLKDEYEDACFAVIAWADETVLKHASWVHHSQWSAFPLQLEHYQTTNAGEELFERLDRLRADQKDLVEIYYLCLGLGFSGRYFLGLEDDLRLNQIRHEQARRLALPIAAVQDVTRLTPQPYDIIPPKAIPIKPPLTHLLLKGGVAILIGIPLILFVVYLLSKPPPPVSPPVQVPKPVTPLPSVPDLAVRVQQWFDAHKALLTCAQVSVQSVAVASGRIQLGGRVASDAQRTDIRTGLQGLSGVTQVADDALQTIPWPFCEVVDLLDPFKRSETDNALGFAARLNKSGTPPLYYKDDNLTIEVQTPAALESYVQVDYYTADQGVGHLFPNPIESQNFFQPNQTFTVGQVNGPQPWRISPPFGLELVTIIVSKTPLFQSPRSALAETAESYLTALRQALQSAPASDVAATFFFIRTREQR